jgi:type II secretory pathway pseudopilin PulG
MASTVADMTEQGYDGFASRAYRKVKRMSLVETCVTIALISVVALFAVPALLQSRDDYVVQSAANDVASKLHAARIRAISRNVDCRLRVISSATYAIECNDPVWIVTETIILPRGMTIVQNAAPQFHRLGNVVPTATITVSNAKGRQKKVIVNNGGRVRIQ